MHRIVKQILYGAVFVLIAALVVFVVYQIALRPAPSCSDGRQNQGESGVDCGGPCVPCGIAQAQNLRIGNVFVFRAGEGVGIAAEVINPNVSFGVPLFSYRVLLKDSAGNEVKALDGTSFVYPGALKYIVVPTIDVNPASVSSAEVEVGNISWSEKDDFSKPAIQITESRTIKDGFLYVNGSLANQDEVDYKDVDIVALLYTNEGNLIAASKTTLDQIEKFGSASFSIPFARDLEIYLPSLDVGQYFPRDLQVGDSGENVSNLQIFLAEIGLLNREPTGFYDEFTQAGVGVLQDQLGLPVSGIFDETTRHAVVEMITGAAEEETEGQEGRTVDTAKTKVFVETKR